MYHLVFGQKIFLRKIGGSKKQKSENVALLINSSCDSTSMTPLEKKERKKEKKRGACLLENKKCGRDVGGAPSPLKLGVGAAAEEARAGRQQAPGGEPASERHHSYREIK